MKETLFDKLWQQHRIETTVDGEDLIAIDYVFLHERTGAVAMKSLEEAGRQIRDPSRVFCTMDHIVSNRAGRTANEARMPGGDLFIDATRTLAEQAGINLIDILDPRQGIVHVIAPELGIAMPGASIVCPDSHTCSLGAFGALAWGIGSTQAEHALATGTLKLTKPKQMRATVTGRLRKGVHAKDLALHLISRYGAAGGQRMAIEFAGPGIEALSVEERLTLCNLAVEFAAFTALIAPDAKTVDYVRGRQFAPPEAHWRDAVEAWAQLRSDPSAEFHTELQIDAADVSPTVSWGTSPEHAVPLDATIPKLADIPADRHDAVRRALDYMDLEPGRPLAGTPINGVFIGSCTNGRIEDLRAAAAVLAGRKVAEGVEAICVPGSKAVKASAEAEGLHDVFREAGFEWGEPGCAMCFYAGGKTFAPGSRVMSTTNRNFEGRQGPGVRTHIASPAIVAASAIAGRIASASEIANCSGTS